MKIAPIEPQARRHLLILAETYCNATGMTLARLSRLAHGDPPFFERLKKEEKTYQRLGKRTSTKGSCTWRVHDKVISWFIDHWPEGITFPDLNDLTYVAVDPQSPDRINQQEKGTDNGATQGKQESPEDREESGTATELLAKLRRGVSG